MSAPPPAPLAVALRNALRTPYGAQRFRADLLAGVVVGIVAVPLSMALAIAVGVPPERGLHTAVVAGAAAAIFGGSKFQVTGPTAAFIVVLAPIGANHGVEGLLLAGLMAGVLLVVMGVARLGRLIQFIPHPVTTGFTSGIATVIALLALKDALGLPGAFPASTTERVLHVAASLGDISLPELVVAGATLAVLVVWPRVTERIPGPLVAIGAASLGAWASTRFGGPVLATVGSRFQSVVDGVVVRGVPRLPPLPSFEFASAVSLARIRELAPSAMAIALLGGIESLLSAVIADGMTGKKHDPDAELVGQGIANVLSPVFGGIAATGALARTATNVRSGATSPVAAVMHSVVVLLAVVVLAPAVAWVPMAALAALLLYVAARMSEARHFLHVVRVAPRSDVVILVVCYVLTVFVDMVAAITVGVVLAALLFMRRMSEITRTTLLESGPEGDVDVPPGVALYRIEGPMFFGAAQRATDALARLPRSTRVIVIDLGRVGAIDVTGLVALESALGALRRAEKFVILAGPLPEPRSTFERAQLDVRYEHVLFCASFDEALAVARDLGLLNPQWGESAAALSSRLPPAA